MSNTCLEGLMNLIRQGLRILTPQEIYILIMLCFIFSPKIKFTHAETFTSDFASADGEASVLIQAILSIKSIIRQDPLGHEKVWFLPDFSIKCFVVFSFTYSYGLIYTLDMLDITIEEL